LVSSDKIIYSHFRHIKIRLKLTDQVFPFRNFRQTIDVYKPENANNSAIIVMIHGGGWTYGDKSLDRVVQNKLTYFGSKGFIFASVNYRMIPEANPFMQALDVAKAIAYLCKQGAEENTMTFP
jgi:acetyl esterase/lipase